MVICRRSCRRITKIALEAQNGETYNIGNNTVTNIDIVNEICKILKVPYKKPRGVRKFKDLITFVEDRPGHDFRYAVDTTKVKEILIGYRMKHSIGSKKNS